MLIPHIAVDPAIVAAWDCVLCKAFCQSYEVLNTFKMGLSRQISKSFSSSNSEKFDFENFEFVSVTFKKCLLHLLYLSGLNMMVPIYPKIFMLCGIVKSVTKMVIGCLRTTKFAICVVCSMKLKGTFS